jgi:hypothetical protein
MKQTGIRPFSFSYLTQSSGREVGREGVHILRCPRPCRAVTVSSHEALRRSRQTTTHAPRPQNKSLREEKAAAACLPACRQTSYSHSHARVNETGRRFARRCLGRSLCFVTPRRLRISLTFLPQTEVRCSLRFNLKPFGAGRPYGIQVECLNQVTMSALALNARRPLFCLEPRSLHLNPFD